MTVTSLQRACASMDAEMNSLCNSFSSLHIYSSEEEVALEMDVEMNSLCNSFSSLRISSSVVKTAPVLVGPVETILEEVALKRDMKLEADKFRDDMIQAGTPFWVCVPLMDNFVPLNNNIVSSDDEDKEVHIEEMMTTQFDNVEEEETTTQFDDDDDDDHMAKAVRDGNIEETVTTQFDNVEEEETTTQFDNNDDDHTAKAVRDGNIDDDDDDSTVTTETATTTTTTTTATSDDYNSTVTTETATTVPADDDDVVNNDEVVRPTVILQLLLALAQYWIGSTVKFALKLATLPLLIVVYIIYKTMKSLTRPAMLDDFEFDYDDQSICSEEERLLEEEEVLEMLYSRQYASEEEFQKWWEFELGTEMYRYCDYKFELQQKYEAAMDVEAEDAATPWWKFW